MSHRWKLKEVQMHYEIVVSQYGQHLFATHERSATNQIEAARLYCEFKARFPAQQGFEITVTEYRGVGDVVTDRMNQLVAREKLDMDRDCRVEHCNATPLNACLYCAEHANYHP
jgi:hypothetical protein